MPKPKRGYARVVTNTESDKNYLGINAKENTEFETYKLCHALCYLRELTARFCKKNSFFSRTKSRSSYNTLVASTAKVSHLYAKATGVWRPDTF